MASKVGFLKIVSFWHIAIAIGKDIVLRLGNMYSRENDLSRNGVFFKENTGI